MRYFLVLLFLLFVVSPVHAEDAAPKARAMIVLDASGSMWGQVDGKNKIVIAREVFANLMQDWDDDVHLGLSAYGHNSKGSCDDIETLVSVGPKTGGAILAKVNEITPKGKTPLSAAVQRAAEELKYTEGVSMFPPGSKLIDPPFAVREIVPSCEVTLPVTVNPPVESTSTKPPL